MASVNKVILVGSLGRDPDMRYTADGTAIATLSIATTEKFKDKAGLDQKHVEWHKAVFFGRLAEVCGQYLNKGSLVYIEGSFRTNKYTDKDGVDRYSTEIRGGNMQMFGGRERQSAPPPQTGGNIFEGMDDDIPL